ncbi:myosin heavy chain, clone 203-like isoform X2 [Macrobrachium nipponense]|uniref:myosin heavy chain, clone 203-like isoform X2 n=1 Tax=Macrobrachium nipponense TaxID=159736 RepID=UPI0030C89D2B
MSRPHEHGGWRTPRHRDKRLVIQSLEAEEPVDQEGKVMLPAAVVHPFTEGDSPANAVSSHLLHRHQLNYQNMPSPYLLSAEASSTLPPVRTKSPATPVVGSVLPAPKNLYHERFQSTPNSQEIELQTLRLQVQEIQNKLNGGILSDPEYQQLLSEKQSLEQTLGATEHELQELKVVFANLEENATQTEKKLNLKLKETKEKHQILIEKYNKASEELRSVKDYLQTIPTQAEHMQLQKQLSKKSFEIAQLNEKVNTMARQIAQQKERESKLSHSVDVLSQEKDDLLLKLRLSESILSDIENQRILAEERGEDTKENLLWRLNQYERELESAKKLLSYRKTKIECLNKQILEQDRKCSEKMQKEMECSEKQREDLWALQRELEECKLTEQKTRSAFKNLEETHKKLEDQLKVSHTQIKGHQEMCSTITALFEKINCAVLTFKDLVEISSQISQGIPPDLSLLLGFPDSVERLENHILTTDDLKCRLTEVNELIHQLESIRATLQDKYAGHIAVNACPQM